MESKSIEKWTNLIANASSAYREYFKFEKKYLTEHTNRGGISLDLGCGDGRSIQTIAKYSNFVIGIDNDEDAVEYAREDLWRLKNTLIVNYDAEDLMVNFHSKQFDTIFCGLSFSNFGNSKDEVLDQISFVLKGQFIFSTYNENALDERLRMYNKAFDSTYSVNPKNGCVSFNQGQITSEQFTQRQLEEMLTKYDFKINDIQKGKIFYMVKCSK